MFEQYTHDCEDCEFMGDLRGADMYICQRSSTKIVRYGNDGADYVSGSSYTFVELRNMVTPK